MKATMHFGYNPRLCFSDSYSETALSGKIEGVQGRIESLAVDSHTFLAKLNSYREGKSDGNDVSHTIFRLSPTDNSLLQSCRYGIVSQWALDCLLSACQAHEKDAALEFYRKLRTGDYLIAPLRGHLFEKVVLSHLDAIEANCNLSIRPLTGSDEITWTYPGPIPRVYFEKFFDKISDAVKKKARSHLVPIAPNYAAADSIVYVPGEVLTLVQATINPVHPIAVSGLKRIQTSLKANTNTNGLCPNQKQPWRFIFIVPEEMALPFKLQNMQGDTPTNVWARKVEQYVFGLKVGSAFDTGEGVRVGE